MTYVQIIKTLIKAECRTAKLPSDTQACDFQMLLKGEVIDIDQDSVTISTQTGRLEKGSIYKKNPTHHHGFGDFVPELTDIRKTILNEMWRQDD